MAILPVLVFGLFMGVFTGSLRERVLLAAIGWGVLVVILSEGLSLWHGLDRFTLAGAWSIILMILAWYFWSSRCAWPQVTMQNPPCVSLILIEVYGILLVTGMIAYLAAPNNWDSMTCHLPRVAHWQQDKGVSLYPTNCDRQILYPPWSGYAMAQFYILAGGDRWVNFIQWFSSLGSMVGVSLIAARLKGSKTAQAFAALIVATIPMGILQSTSTQNDYAAAFWLVCFVYFGLALLQEGGWLYGLAASASLGLAWLVKGTPYIYSFPFIIWFLAAGLRIYGPKFLIRMASIIVIALLLSSPYYARNYSLTGSVVPPSEAAHISKTLDLPAAMANLMMNVGLHAATPFESANQSVERIVDSMLQTLGIKPGDARVFYSCDKKFDISYLVRHEDYAPNALHALMILFCLVSLWFAGRRIPQEVRSYSLPLLGGILLFVLVCHWSTYHSRYHLPIFVLFAPCVAVIFGSWLKDRELLIVSVVLVTASLPWLIGNKTRPLLGARSILMTSRLDQYFIQRPEIRENYEQIARQLRGLGCTNVGIVSTANGWEYPLWVLLKGNGPPGNWRLEHVLINNDSARLPYPLGSFKPCAVVTVEDEPLGRELSERFFKKVWERKTPKGFKTSLYLPLNNAPLKGKMP